MVVPATRFWKGLSTESSGTTDRRPPWRAIWLLLAAAFAILAAAGPQIRRAQNVTMPPQTTPTEDVALLQAFASDRGLRLVIDAQVESPTSVEVVAGDVVETLTIEPGLSHHRLPPSGAESVSLRIADGQSDNNTALIVRGDDRPRLGRGLDLPSSLLRFADAFEALKPPSDRTVVLAITPNRDTRWPTISLATVDSEATFPITIADFEPAFGVRWDRLNDLQLTSEPLPERDEVVVSDATGRPMVAVDRRKRHVWIGFRSEEFTKTGDFVRFWADMITWADEQPVVRRQIGLDTEAVAAGELFRSSAVRTDARPVALLLALVATLLAGATGARRGV